MRTIKIKGQTQDIIKTAPCWLASENGESLLLPKKNHVKNITVAIEK